MALGVRRGSRELDRYLLDGEKLVAAVHQHWAIVAPYILATAAALLVALYLDFSLARELQPVSTLAWWLFFGVFLWAAYHVISWQRDWFVATDKRLLLFHGFITRKVSMMPLIKVTDMSYTRSVTGRVLGFGRFVMESAGQDQALSTINFVPNPTYHYRAICAEIFGVDDEARVEEVGEEAYAGPPPMGGPGSPGGTGGSGDRSGPGDTGSGGPRAGGPVGGGSGGRGGSAGGGGSSGYSTAIPIHRPVTPEEQTRPEDEIGRIHDFAGPTSTSLSIYRSPDLMRADRRRAGQSRGGVDREADTGPIPIYPREEWT